MANALRVLIVEDRPGDAELMVRHLRQEGYVPDWRCADDEADYLAALEWPPEVILADWSLPRFSGLRALELVRERNPDIPFIIVSGRIGEEAAVDALRSGAVDYVLKDRMARLGQAVVRALQERRLRHEQRASREALQQSEERVRQKLNAILDPNADIGTLDLADIIDCTAIQSLMNDFYRLTRIGVAIVDMRGRILVATGWQEICTRFHRVHPETHALCLESDIILSQGVAPGDFKLYRCKNRMWDIATPIVVSGKHLGNLFLGQFFFDDETPDYEDFRRMARQYGFDEAEYIAALDQVPRWSRETVNAAMAFYASLAGIIARLSHSGVNLSRALGERDTLLESLKASEEKYRILVHHAGEAMIVAQEGKLVFANPKCLELVGYASDEALSRPFIDFVHLEDRAMVLDRHMQRARGVELPPIYEFRVLRKTGEVRWVELNAALISWEGRPATLNFLSDITERKQAEEEVRQLTELLECRVRERTAQLEAANKELEAFSYSVSHDLRAPLRAIDGYARILEEDHSSVLNDEGRRMLGVVRGEARRMGLLIEDLLRLSRLGRQPLRKVQTDMVQLAGAVYEQLRPDASRRCVDFRLGALPAVYADPGLLRQVWENLLGNALKYSRNRDRTEIQVTGRVEGGEAVYSVRDNGAGFDMTYSNKLFGVFQRLHRQDEFEGTGVGLALVHRIVRRHGGRVWGEGEKDRGATFHFSLPLVRPAADDRDDGAQG